MSALARRAEGLSIKISKQSTITAQFGQCFLKSIGRVFLSTSLSGHMMKCFSLLKRMSITVLNIREMVER